jgi:hypothetical protein
MSKASEVQAATLKAAGGNSSGVLAYIFSAAVLKRNVTIALIVGCVLSLANQYDLLLRTPMNTRLAAKIFFNFLVPFIVSSASAAANRKQS